MPVVIAADGHDGAGADHRTHIACHLCVHDHLFPIKAKEAVALHERRLVNVPSASEAGHGVDGVARTYIEGGGPVTRCDSGTSRYDQHAFRAVTAVS